MVERVRVLSEAVLAKAHLKLKDKTPRIVVDQYKNEKTTRRMDRELGRAPGPMLGEARDFSQKKRSSLGAAMLVYDEAEDCATVYKLALLGLPNIAITRNLGIHKDTFYTWLKTYPQFCMALELGRERADAEVADALHRRATGFHHRTEKIFQFQGQEVVVPYDEYVVPDVAAAIYWLNNRGKGRWKTRSSEEHVDSEGNTINTGRPPNITINAVQIVREGQPALAEAPSPVQTIEGELSDE